MRSGGEHCQAELAAEVRTAIMHWQLRSGEEHCHPELAVEEEVEAEEKEEEGS